MSPERLAEIEARLQAAAGYYLPMNGMPMGKPLYALAHHAPTDIAELVAEVQRLQKLTQTQRRAWWMDEP